MSLLLKVLTTPGEFHPFIDLNHCVNRKQKWLECRACVDICPKHVYDETLTAKPKWTECQNYGLCVSACTARCIAPSTPNAKRQVQLTGGEQSVTISCKDHEVANSHTEPCIGTLPWEYLAYLALDKKLVLNLTGCGACPHKECVELLQKQLTRLKSFLGEEEFAARVEMRMQEAKAGEEARMSRRDLLREGLQKTVQGTVQLAGDSDSPISGMAYRKLLADRVRTIYKETAKEERKPYYMNLPWFQEDCYGCGNCAKLCPNQAIEITRENEDTCLISVTPWRCVGCGVCTAVCREHGVQGNRRVKIPYLDKLPMARVKSKSCQRCGRPMKPTTEGEYCASCKQKVKQKR